MNAQELQEAMRLRLRELPKPVRDAIQSADLEKHLRELADTNKLHIDQWQLLENDVMLTLLGFQEPEELAGSLEKDLEIPKELAESLAGNVSRIVFEPIRIELERELALTTPPDAEQQIETLAPAPQAVIPATPPAAAPIGQVERAQISDQYAPAQPSHERKTPEGDPYREQVI